jgi:D-alanyl-D-alanine carboxypeptidase
MLRAIGLGLALAAGQPAALAGPALLFDAGSGQVIYAEDADRVWHPASLTKLMTVYVVLDAVREGKLTLASELTVSLYAYSQAPTRAGLAHGAKVTVELALKAVIIKSANDLSMTLAEAVSGEEDVFVERMNETAKRLGMTRTRFVNPNGLPEPEQVTTARDMALLARALLRDFPEHAGLFAEAQVKIGRRLLNTHNGLLRNFDGADGMKTGFICSSGYNVVASATRGQRKLVAVVLGEQTGLARTLRAASLLEHGFEMAAWKTLVDPVTLDALPVDAEASAAVFDFSKDVRSAKCPRYWAPGERPARADRKLARRAAGKRG